ncbi:MAG: hypothetical protein HOF21_04140 [Nitrospina sp.]|jgi:hypothetical protein|nr:hypothetical protein [Nitrospina sp.]
MPIDFQDPITAFLSDKTLSVPLGQVLLFALMLTLCLLFGRHKLGLLISYAFVFFWGFIFNRGYFIDMLGNTSMGLYVYTLFGFIMAVLAIVGLLKKS